MFTRSHRMKTFGGLATDWLGLSTLGVFVMLVAELLVRAPEAMAVGALAYLAVLALGATALFSLAVAAVHAPRAIFPERSTRAFVLALCALAALSVPSAVATSAALVEGDWISKHPHVRALRVLFAVLLVLGNALVWVWHAFGASEDLRTRMLAALRMSRHRALAEGLFFAAGLAVLAAVVVSLGGVLRPYVRVAEVLLVPCWLLAATLGFRLRELLKVRTTAVALVLSCVFMVPLALHALVPDRLAAGRGAALGAKGLGAYIDPYVTPRDPRLIRLDFAAVNEPACAPPRQPAPLPLTAAQRHNVIILSVDTMRADAIGKRFGKREVAPNLEAFGRESIYFARAMAPAPITLLSIGSAFSGRSLNQLWWLPRTPDSVWKTARGLFPRSRIFLPSWAYFKARNFSRLIVQGTPVRYQNKKVDRAGMFIAELERARAAGERGMFWLHLADPHLPYRPPAKYRFGSSVAERYYGEVAYDDAVLGQVLEFLRSHGYYESSLIIVFSDHGEALAERGRYTGHGTSMVGRFTDVPLYVRYPGVTPRVSTEPVVLTEIAPTILHYLEQPIPDGVAACSLLDGARDVDHCLPPVSQIYGVATRAFNRVLASPVRTRDDLERRQDAILSWRRMPPELAAISSNRRYVRDLNSGVEHIYALPDRSNERTDLVSSEPDTLRAFRDQVARFRRAEAERVTCQLDER